MTLLAYAHTKDPTHLAAARLALDPDVPGEDVVVARGEGAVEQDLHVVHLVYLQQLLVVVRAEGRLVVDAEAGLGLADGPVQLLLERGTVLARHLRP